MVAGAVGVRAPKLAAEDINIDLVLILPLPAAVMVVPEALRGHVIRTRVAAQ